MEGMRCFTDIRLLFREQPIGVFNKTRLGDRVFFLSILSYLVMLTTTLLSLSLYFLALFQSSDSFDLVRDYSGTTFFDRWDFFGSWDNLTLGVLARISISLSATSPPSQATFGGWTANRLSRKTLHMSTRTIVSSSKSIMLPIFRSTRKGIR